MVISPELSIANFLTFWYHNKFSTELFDIIFESFVLEIVATGVYCGTAIFLPIIIFDRFFKNMKINWTPSIIFLFLFFSYFGFEMLKLTFSVISNPNAGFTDIFRMIVMIVGYCIGFITPLFYAYIYNNK